MRAKLDPPMVPYIALFHVANDNKLDYIGTLLGEEITADSLLQALVIAEDMHLHLLTDKKLPAQADKDEEIDFKPRAVQRGFNVRNDTSLSK